MNLNELKEDILADGVIDAAEVVRLETALFEDGIIDKEEMEFLVGLADETDSSQNDPSFGDFYVKCVRSRYLEDDNSPGVIDAEEAQEIKELFYGDGSLNDYERNVLFMIKNEATLVDPILQDVIDLVV